MIRVSAFAKINLSFRVLHRRTDGFHEINSLVQTIDLADEIDITKNDGLIEIENDLVLPPGKDLAWRAARAVLDEKESSIGVRIVVRKRIPAGAGLGGGSSDAAATLWGVDRLTLPGLSHETLCTIAADLGSDVPLFLTGGLVRATGRGECITVAGVPRKEWFVILVPPIHCDTARVYAAWDDTSHVYEDRPPLALGENDLSAAAFSVYPKLVAYRQAVIDIGAAYAGMSGSGSAFYAAFPEHEAALAAKTEMEKKFPQADVYLCRGTDKGFAAKGEG